MNSAQLQFLSMFVWLLLVVSTGIAQTSTSATRATATISGRITIEGQPAQGVEVTLLRDDDWRRLDFGLGIPALPAATTDAEGRYKLSNVAAGGYVLLAHAPAYVVHTSERRRRSNSGKALNVAENDNLENVDITMTRGGVVTGKVTDEDGRPVIAESVTIFRLDQQGKRIETDAFEPFGREETDDRGIYRIFGIEAGRYLVAAGSSPEEINTRLGAFYRRTYHPDATDESKAKVIEIKPGGENENVDIRITRPTKGYAASGRVIDAETGRPVPGVIIHYGILKETRSSTSASFNLVNWPTNSAGEFRLEGLSPNPYKVGVANLEKTDFYSDQVDFEIVSGDVTGLEVKLSRGASIYVISWTEIVLAEARKLLKKKRFSREILSPPTFKRARELKQYIEQVESAPEDLKTLTAESGGEYWRPAVVSEFMLHRPDRLVSEVDSEYTLTYLSPKDKLDRPANIPEIHIARPGMSVFTRQAVKVKREAR